MNTDHSLNIEPLVAEAVQAFGIPKIGEEALKQRAQIAAARIGAEGIAELIEQVRKRRYPDQSATLAHFMYLAGRGGSGTFGNQNTTH